MNNLDLSEKNIERLCNSFADLLEAPKFSICDDMDVHILFFKRKDKYSGIRTGLKAEFSSREEFLIYSLLTEEIRAHTKNALSLEQLKVEKCSNTELSKTFSAVRISSEYYPQLSDVERSYFIVNNSDVHWIFIEDNMEYHSVFWGESESKLFSRCA